MIKTGNRIKAANFTPLYTCGETIAAGDAVAFDYSTSKIFKASGAALDKRINFIGIAVSAGVLDGDIYVDTNHIIDWSGMTKNTTMYLSDTNGEFSSSAGTIKRIVGRAMSATEIYRPKNGAPCGDWLSYSPTTAVAAIAFAGSRQRASVTINGNTIYGTGGNYVAVGYSLFVKAGDTVSIGGDTTYASPKYILLDM